MVIIGIVKKMCPVNDNRLEKVIGICFPPCRYNGPLIFIFPPGVGATSGFPN